jgi:hypothetical protein
MLPDESVTQLKDGCTHAKRAFNANAEIIHLAYGDVGNALGSVELNFSV